MAIFDFVKSAGQSLSEGLEQAAETAAEAVESLSMSAVEAKIKASDIECKDLSLKKVDDETVKVYAVVSSAEAKENLILMVGNTPGVAKVEDAVKVVAVDGSTGGGAASKFYTVVSGDSLSAIAQRELGDANRYMEIFEANRNILTNPDAIDVGQTLRIPQA